MKIYCFVNSGAESDWQNVLAMCEDGNVLASHISSSEHYARNDIGITSDRKHDLYKKHCLDGYKLVWVDWKDVNNHEGIASAYIKNQEIGKLASQ